MNNFEKRIKESQKVAFESSNPFSKRVNHLDYQNARFAERKVYLFYTAEKLKSKNIRSHQFTNFVNTAENTFYKSLEICMNTESSYFEISTESYKVLPNYYEKLGTHRKNRVDTIIGEDNTGVYVFKGKKQFEKVRIFVRMKENHTYELEILDPYHLMVPTVPKNRNGTILEVAKSIYSKRANCKYCFCNLLVNE